MLHSRTLHARVKHHSWQHSCNSTMLLCLFQLCFISPCFLSTDSDSKLIQLSLMHTEMCTHLHSAWFPEVLLCFAFDYSQCSMHTNRPIYLHQRHTYSNIPSRTPNILQGYNSLLCLHSDFPKNFIWKSGDSEAQKVQFLIPFVFQIFNSFCNFPQNLLHNFHSFLKP